jgi:hypothetical protein
VNDATRLSCATIENVLGQSPAFKKVDRNFYVVRQGSAYVYLLAVDWGDERSLLRFVAQLASGVEMTPDLAMKLLRLNARMRFGAFGYVRDGRCVTFSHTLLGGETLDREDIVTTLRDIALVADEYDDRVIEEAGGQTMQQILEESALSALKSELEHQGWGEA